MLTQRRALEWTIVLGGIALFVFVPFLRDHRTAILVPYVVVVLTVELIRGKPEGSRVLVLSFLAPVVALVLFGLAVWINIWLGAAFIVVVPAIALVVASRRDRRAAATGA